MATTNTAMERYGQSLDQRLARIRAATKVAADIAKSSEQKRKKLRPPALQRAALRRQNQKTTK